MEKVKFEIERNVLVEGLKKVGKALPSKPQMDILRGIKVELTGTKVRLVASDVDNTIISTVDMASMIPVSGSFVVLDGNLFTQGVSKMPNGVIECLVDDSEITVQTGRAEFSTPVKPAEEYPSITSLGQTQSVKISAEDLKSMINASTYCAAIGETTRPILNGAKLEVKDNTIIMVSLDGVRLALAKKTVTSSESVSAIVPAAGLNAIHSIIGDGELEICIGQNQICIKDDSTEATVRLIQGEYINYASIIPKEFSKKAVLNKEEMIEAIDRADLAAKEKKGTIVLMFEDNSLKISCETAPAKSRSTVSLDNYEGENMKICFNAKFLQDALKKIPGESIAMCMSTNVSPAVLKAANAEDSIHMVLPMRGID